MKAIQTRYKGCHFRSRLEARWAVCFDALDLEWHYEPEGFELGDAGRYLPDFYLPKFDVWAEVKPQKLNALEREKAFALSSFTNKPVIELCQIPDPDLTATIGCMIVRWYYGINCTRLTDIPTIPLLVDYYFEQTAQENVFDWEDFAKTAVQWDAEHYKRKHEKSHPTHFETGAISEHESFPFGAKLYNAIIKARSARFEHGQEG